MSIHLLICLPEDWEDKLSLILGLELWGSLECILSTTAQMKHVFPGRWKKMESITPLGNSFICSFGLDKEQWRQES